MAASMPRIQRAEDRAGHGHGEVQLVHGRHVCAEDSYLRVKGVISSAYIYLLHFGFPRY